MVITRILLQGQTGVNSPQIPDILFYLILIGVGIYLFSRWSEKSKKEKIDDIKKAPKKIFNELKVMLIIAAFATLFLAFIYYGMKGMSSLF